ncbi:MAG: hypothetical protein FWG50_01460 [Kiritimatiellaeota bacterium]|nr:hypothetical protein [Kiritimatiellota bacterium]
MKKTILIIGLLAIGLVGGWLVLKGRQPGGTANGGSSSTAGTKRGPAGRQQPVRPGWTLHGGGATSGVASVAGAAASTNARPDWGGVDLIEGAENLSAEEKQWIEKLQTASDADDLQGVKEAARQLKNSKSAAVRTRLASLLGWFGTAALPELIDLLGDADAEVAEATMIYTLEAIDEMDDGPEKAELLAALIATLSDLDAIDDALMRFAPIDDDIVIPILEGLIAKEQDPAKRAALQDYLAFTKGEMFAS